MHTLKMTCSVNVAAEAIEIVTFGALDTEYSVNLLSKWMLGKPVKLSDPKWKLSATTISEELRVSNSYVKTEIVVQPGGDYGLITTITAPSRSAKRLMDAFQKWDSVTIQFDGNQTRISTIRELLAKELDTRPVPRG